MMKLENNTIKKLNKNPILKDKIRKKKTNKQTNCQDIYLRLL